jgi:hypothetical protein
MQQDAFTAGVQPDGLKNKSDIKVLVCFLISNCSQSLSRKDLTDIFLERGLANYFEANDAISSLIKNKNLIENADDGSLSITDSGKFIADTLYDGLPVTVREKSLDAMSKILNRRHISKLNKTHIDACDKGYNVTCSINDGTMETLKLTLYVPTYNYATLVRDRFLDDPETLYRAVMAQLTDTPQIAPKPRQTDKSSD